MSMAMKRVVIESPYAGDVERNTAYAKACLFDSLMRGEAPFASHLLYTLVLDDDSPEERELGIVAGFIWGATADRCAVYTDLGISPGMRAAMELWTAKGVPVEHRSIQGWGYDGD